MSRALQVWPPVETETGTADVLALPAEELREQLLGAMHYISDAGVLKALLGTIGGVASSVVSLQKDLASLRPDRLEARIRELERTRRPQISVDSQLDLEASSKTSRSIATLGIRVASLERTAQGLAGQVEILSQLLAGVIARYEQDPQLRDQAIAAIEEYLPDEQD